MWSCGYLHAELCLAGKNLICCNFCLLETCEVEITFSTDPAQLIQSVFEHSTSVGRSRWYACLAQCIPGWIKIMFACSMNDCRIVTYQHGKGLLLSQVMSLKDCFNSLIFGSWLKLAVRDFQQYNVESYAVIKSNWRGGSSNAERISLLVAWGQACVWSFACQRIPTLYHNLVKCSFSSLAY